MKKFIILTLVVCTLGLITACGTPEAEDTRELTDVSQKNEEAAKLYENGQYEDSIKLYNEAMTENPIDMDSRIGIVENYIALENYNMAAVNLSSSYMVDPKDSRIYELYVEMSQKTENIHWAQTAIDLAKEQKMEEFLAGIPKAPEFTMESGAYNERINVDVICANADAKVYVTEIKDSNWLYNGEYSSDFDLTTGETKLSAYCVVDGVPSETTEATYICSYSPTPVKFSDPVFEELIRTELNIPFGEITDVDCEQLNQISTYDLRNNYDDYSDYQKVKIYSIEDIKYFPNLTYVSFDDQDKIQSYEPLVNCRRITNISIYDGNVTSIDFVTRMPLLNYIYIERSNLTDITPILSCKNLRGLNIEDNPVNVTGELKVLENLSYFGFSDHQVTDWNVFRDWDTILDLRVNGIKDIDYDVISGMTQLTELDIYRDWDDYDGFSSRENTYIMDLAFIEPLENLTYLYLSGLKDLSQIYHLENLKNLNNLYLYNRYETDKEKDEEYINKLQMALPNCSIKY